MQVQMLSLDQLLERFRGFLSIAKNPNFINLRAEQLAEYIATLENVEGDIQLLHENIHKKQVALNFILANCPVCSRKAGSPMLCSLCATAQLAGGDRYGETE